MASDTVVRAPMDGQIKEGAARALADMGLPVFRRDPASAGLRGGREGRTYLLPPLTWGRLGQEDSCCRFLRLFQIRSLSPV